MKRYDLEYIAYGSVGQNEMREATEGDWVKLSDACEAIAREKNRLYSIISELTAQRDEARALIRRGADTSDADAADFVAECAEAVKRWEEGK